jgi:hypothetical protein
MDCADAASAAVTLITRSAARLLHSLPVRTVRVTKRPEVERVYVYNESVSYDTYKAFDRLIRLSKLSELAGTITLSMDTDAMSIVATFKIPSATLPPETIAHGRTVEGLFAQVLSLLSPSLPAV